MQKWLFSGLGHLQQANLVNAFYPPANLCTLAEFRLTQKETIQSDKDGSKDTWIKEVQGKLEKPGCVDGMQAKFNSTMSGRKCNHSATVHELGEQMRSTCWWLPAWICQTTHHDHMPSLELQGWDTSREAVVSSMAKKQVGESFELFEITPFFWGSTRLGFLRVPRDGRLEVGTAMEIKCLVCSILHVLHL